MRAAALFMAVLLVGCGSEPSFDERYQATEKSIRDKATQIDAELAEKERQAAEAVGSPVAGSQATPRR